MAKRKASLGNKRITLGNKKANGNIKSGNPLKSILKQKRYTIKTQGGYTNLWK